MHKQQPVPQSGSCVGLVWGSLYSPCPPPCVYIRPPCLRASAGAARECSSCCMPSAAWAVCCAAVLAPGVLVEVAAQLIQSVCGQITGGAWGAAWSVGWRPGKRVRHQLCFFSRGSQLPLPTCLPACLPACRVCWSPFPPCLPAFPVFLLAHPPSLPPSRRLQRTSCHCQTSRLTSRNRSRPFWSR